MLKSLLASLLLAALPFALQAKELFFVTEDFPPFTYSSTLPDSNKTHPSGPIVDIVRATCARLATYCPIEVVPWRRATSLAEQGEVDGIFTVINTPERRANFHITRMLVTSAYGVYSLKGNPFIYQTPTDLEDLTVGVYGPSGTQLVLQQTIDHVPNVKVEMLSNNRSLLRMLESGRFGPTGVVVINQEVAAKLIEQEQLHNIQHVGTLAKVAYGIGFAKHRVDLQRFNEFDQKLGELTQDGTIPSILHNYQVQGAWQASEQKNGQISATQHAQEPLTH